MYPDEKLYISALPIPAIHNPERIILRLFGSRKSVEGPVRIDPKTMIKLPVIIKSVLFHLFGMKRRVKVTSATRMVKLKKKMPVLCSSNPNCKESLNGRIGSMHM